MFATMFYVSMEAYDLMLERYVTTENMDGGQS